MREVYLSGLEWTKTHGGMGGVMGNVIFKDNMTYEDYETLLKSGYFVLCSKDYITNLQQDTEMYAQLKDEYEEEIKDLQQENERLKEISKKMHLWIFLHSGDEQKAYDELGLTDEENAILGYSGQIRIGSDDNE